MWPVSLRFLHTLRYSHTKVTYVDLYRDDVPIAAELPLLSAVVDDDRSASIRRRCDVVLAGTSDVMELLPENPTGNGGLWPTGNELRIRSGIRYDTGEEELVPMGVFRIANPVVSNSSGGDRTVAIKGYDRSRAVSRNRFTVPYIIPITAVNVPQEIKRLVLNRLPTLNEDEFLLMLTDYNPPPRAFTRDVDPWKDAAAEMAKGIGAEVFFDGLGRLVVRAAPNPLADPVSFEYVEGEEANWIELERNLDDEQGYNGVIASSQSSDNSVVVQGQFWDTNPNSPTYFDPTNPSASIYGAVPYYYVSEFIRTQEQADDAARGIFNGVTGIVESIDLSAICNPAHESGDTIKVQSTDANVDDVNLMDAIKFDLVNGVMAAQTRRRAVGEPV